jgi:hypothetical protein
MMNSNINNAAGDSLSKTTTGEGDNAIGTIQRTNLRFLDNALRQHWNLGQNILLCWCVHPEGIQVLLVPHYFLGHFSASLNDCDPIDRLEALNGRFIRELIAGSRLLSATDLAGAASRLQLTATTIPLPVAIKPQVSAAIDEMIKRYSINYVKSRAVLLFDIVNFSLVSPFEQSSQLNSLSYSLNSAHNKLRKQNIEINFSRTTTGDGYYVWHHGDSPRSNLELFQFMLLVVADNALAQRAAVNDPASGQTVPKIRTGFHIGSHFEFYQVEGLNPGMNSFIVGDVTIELARILDLARCGQIFVGDFDTLVPTSYREGAYLIQADSQRFVERAAKQMISLQGVTLAGEKIEGIHCFLTGDTGPSGGRSVRRFRITDKHGRSRNAYNLRINIRSSGKSLILGLPDNELPRRYYRRTGGIALFNKGRRVSDLGSRSKASIASYED